MNRILFESQEIQPDGTVTFADGRAVHVRDVLKSKAGDTLKIGVINGSAGTGRVLAITADAVQLAATLDAVAPEPWVDLLLAVPRPKVLKRLWSQLAALGVGRIALVNAARVERTYFETHWIQETHYRPLLVEGLMQSGATQIPQVTIHRLFRPFIEDSLDSVFSTPLRIVAHPGPAMPPPVPDGGVKNRPLVAIGPEGGWTTFELEMLAAHGFKIFSFGERILRSDTASIALLAILHHHYALRK